MFETFNVPGLYISVQAILALAASWTAQSDASQRTLTGTVIDSGDGGTHVIPVAEGYVIGSCISTYPSLERDITKFVQQLMRDRGEPIPPEDSLLVAKAVKERYCYCCPDLIKEFNRYDSNPGKYIKQYIGTHARTKTEWSCDVGYERFLAQKSSSIQKFSAQISRHRLQKSSIRQFWAAPSIHAAGCTKILFSLADRQCSKI